MLSGIGESLLSCLFTHYTDSVGASGALFGFLEGMLSELLTNWTIHANKLTTLMTLVLIIAMNLAVGILPYVDNYAHLGGFVTGFFLGFNVLVRQSMDGLNIKVLLQVTLCPHYPNPNKRHTSMCYLRSL